MELLGILIVFAIVLAAYLYNLLVRRRNQSDLAAAGIDVYLKQRFDLIPQLVATVQGYMKHERDTLTQLTELRARAMAGNQSVADKVTMDAQMTPLLGGIRMAVENYPELKASQNFSHLQGSINEVEEKIAAARRNFNGSVTTYNNAVQMFPINMLAGLMGFKVRPLFAIPVVERQNSDAKQLFSDA